MELVLHTDGIYSSELDISKFAQMLDDSSQCYKYYWLEAILNLMSTNDGDLSFEQIIDEMICDAWYSVTRYKLHLGPMIRGKSENFIEHAINVINQDNQFSYAFSKDEILSAIKQNKSEIVKDKRALTKYVPYRLLSSFMDEIGGNNKMWDSSKQMILYLELLNEDKPLPYIIIDGKGMEKKVRIHPKWRQFILNNFPIIQGWIQIKKVRYLQDRNPGVPGIIYKLNSENEKDVSCQMPRSSGKKWQMCFRRRFTTFILVTRSTFGRVISITLYRGRSLPMMNFGISYRWKVD